MTERSAILIRRVLVAMRPMDRPDEVIEIATRLAAAFGAELSGHFVKDRDLINFAAELVITRKGNGLCGQGTVFLDAQKLLGCCAGLLVGKRVVEQGGG